MTYLQLVNKVLTRLREETVSTVSQNTYSALVGEFVNDAKQSVEDAWDWSALRTTLTLTTSNNIFNYNLTGSGNRIEILDVVNDTSNFFLRYKDQHWFNNTFLNNDPVKGSPTYYTFNGVDANGDTAVDIYPIPNGVYSIRFNSILRTPELSEDTDQVLIPNLPIIHLATAFAARERGETGGTAAAELFAIADKTLSDAIALDASKHPEELIYQAV
jgi:hypothetical protein